MLNVIDLGLLFYCIHMQWENKSVDMRVHESKLGSSHILSVLLVFFFGYVVARTKFIFCVSSDFVDFDIQYMVVSF